MSQQRRTISADQKLAIVKRLVMDKVPISQLADEHGVQPSQIYHWQAQLFEYGARVFERQPSRKGTAASAERRRITKLEAVVAQKDAKLAQKNEVIAELLEENVRAKKECGEL